METRKCNSCFETDKLLIQPCNCNGTTCRDCLDGYMQDHGHQCMICRQSIPRLKYFFAGKITEELREYPPGYDYYEDYYEKPSFHNKIFVIDKSKIYSTDDKDIVEDLQNEKGARWEELPNDTTFVSLETYLNPDERIPWINFKKYILTGPCCILDPDILSINHGCWLDSPYANPIDIVKTLNQRNDEMIHDCEVFSLRINTATDCFRSIAEWGMAKTIGKILLIDFDDYCKQKKEFYTLIQDCISSLNTLDDNKKELVIHCHPELSEKFTSFQCYKQYLETIMKSKMS